VNNGEKAKQWARIVAKAWADEAFKKRLLSDPIAVLKAEGDEVPAGISFRVVENTESTVYLVLPAMPKGAGNLQDLEARIAAHGSGHCGY